MAKRIVLGVVLAAFLVQTVRVLAGIGFVGFFESAGINDATRLMFYDLVIALVLMSIWMRRDAARQARRFWPYALLTLTLGSAGPLLYLLVGTFSNQCAVEPGKPPVRQGA